MSWCFLQGHRSLGLKFCFKTEGHCHVLWFNKQITNLQWDEERKHKMPLIQKVKLTSAVCTISVCYRNYSSLFFNYILQSLINYCLYSTQSLAKALYGYFKTAQSLLCMGRRVGKNTKGKKMVEGKTTRMMWQPSLSLLFPFSVWPRCFYNYSSFSCVLMLHSVCLCEFSHLKNKRRIAHFLLVFLVFLLGDNSLSNIKMVK